MAKQLVNPVERHVEKAVLGVAGLLLIGVAAKYLVTSPNQLELGGEFVSPGTIDAKLAQKAASVRDRIRTARVQEEMPEPLYGMFLEGLDPLKQAGVPLGSPSVVPIGPEVPIIDKAQPGPGGSQLVKVAPMSEPALTHGRSTFLLTTPDGELHRVANWVTISALFDVKAQMNEQRREYGAMRKTVIFARPQLQRRARRDDGSWSDEDWSDVEGWSWPPAAIPTAPRITLTDEDGQLVVPRIIRSRVEQFFEKLREPSVQLDLLRPLLPPIRNGDKWTFPTVTTYRNVLMEDDYYLNPDAAPSTNPVDRYRVGEEALGPAERVAVTTAQRLDEVRELLESARRDNHLNGAIQAYNTAFEIEHDADTGPADRKAAAKLTAAAELAIADIRRKIYAGRRTQPVQPGPDDDKPKRDPLPVQQLWVHDATEGSVESGRTYQYRLRPVIYNRLTAQAEKFRDPADATVPLLPGEWSKAVEVTIEPDTYFFVTGDARRKGLVSIEFYKWFEGVWVKSRFRFGVGDALRREDRVEVPSLDDPNATERPLVEFAAGAAIVDIDFVRAFRERKKGSSRAGVKFGPMSTACCVVLADAEGRLYERFVQTDKRHPNKREIHKRVWSPPRKD